MGHILNLVEAGQRFKCIVQYYVTSSLRVSTHYVFFFPFLTRSDSLVTFRNENQPYSQESLIMIVSDLILDIHYILFITSM